MAWPLSQDYNEAIQNPASSFVDVELRGGQPVVNALGVPLPRSGNFADVYEFEGVSGARWAVKCFTREVPGLQERYGEISKFLSAARLPFTVDFQYLEEGIRIRGQWYPVLKMQWVAGFLLNEFVRNNLDKPHLIDKLVHIWRRMGKRLHEAAIAHADLQHGNVILVPGSKASALAVKLIDYDGMFVPALASKKSGELGHPSYQHPQRLQQGIYSAEVDRLPLLAIACGLRCLTVAGKTVWERYDNSDNLLFREADLRTPGESALLRELWNLRDTAAHDLVGHLTLGLTGALEQVPLLHELTTDGREIKPLTPAQEDQVTTVLGLGAGVTRVAVAAVAAGLETVPVAEPAPRDAWESLEEADEPILPRPRQRIARASMLPWVFGAAVLGVAMVGGLVFLLTEKKGDHEQHKPEIVQKPPAKTPGDSEKENKNPKKSAPPGKEHPGKATEVIAKVPTEEWTDLLGLITPKNLPSHVYKGNWVMDGRAVVSDPSQPSLLKIPYPLPEEYVLKAGVERLQGLDAVALALVAAGHRFSLVFDRGQGKKCGLEMVDGKSCSENDNPTTQAGPFFAVGKPRELVCRVQKKNITISLDGKEMIHWDAPARLSASWGVPDKTYPYLGSWASSFKFTHLEVRAATPEPPQVAGDWKHVRTDMAEVKDGLIRIEPKGDVRTIREYTGPLEIRLEARSESKRITVTAHRTAFVLSLPDADSWHPIRMVITEKSVERWIGNQHIVTTREKDLAIAGSVLVRASGSAMDLKSLEVNSLDANMPVVAQPPKPPPVPAKPVTLVLNHVPDKVVDLLSLVDTTKQTGFWELDGGTLSSDRRPFSRLDIPFGPIPDEYQVTAVVERIKGGDAFCLGLIANVAQFMVVLDARQKSGLEVVEGLYATDKRNRTHYSGPIFKTFAPVNIVCKVQKKDIRVTVDDKFIIGLPGYNKGFGLQRAWSAGDKNSLFLGSQQTEYRITKLELVPLSKRGEKVTVQLALPGRTALPVPRWTRPGEDELSAADKELRLAFAKQFAGTTESERLALVQVLWQEGLAAKTPTRCFASLVRARDVAASLFAFPLVLESCKALAERFDVDPLLLRIDALELAAKTAKDADRYAVMFSALSILDELLQADDFDSAVRLKNMNLSSNATWLNTTWKSRIRALDYCQKEYVRIKDERSRLKTDPIDSSANLAVGRYLCFFKEDWSSGLPLLRASGALALGELASRELAAPGDPKSQIDLGESWLKLAATEQVPEQIQDNLRRHARGWFYKALPLLPPTEQKELTPKLGLKMDGKPLKAGLEGQYHLLDDNDQIKASPKRLDYQLNFTRSFAPSVDDVSPHHFSARWLGWLVAPRPGYYCLQAKANQGCRVYLDGNKIIDALEAPGAPEALVLLTGRPQQIRVDYRSKDQGGSMILSWSLIGGFPDQVVPVPPEALFH